MEANNTPPNQPQQVELDPRVKEIFEEVETKLNQVNLLLVLQFSNNLMMNCLSQLPHITSDEMILISNPVVAALNAAIAYSEKLKKEDLAKMQGNMQQGPSSPMKRVLSSANDAPDGSKLN
jgi:DNA-binding protein YbaB